MQERSGTKTWPTRRPSTSRPAIYACPEAFASPGLPLRSGPPQDPVGEAPIGHDGLPADRRGIRPGQEGNHARDLLWRDEELVWELLQAFQSLRRVL